MPDHGGELGGDLVHRVYAGRAKAAAAARSTGLRPIHFIHFIHFIEAAVINRMPNLLEGISNHYRIVMFGKPKLLLGTSFVLRVRGSYPTKGMSFAQ